MTGIVPKPGSHSFSSIMCKNITLRLLPIACAILLLPPPAFCDTPIERWKALIVAGTQSESKANYKGAIAAFGAAVHSVEIYHLPAKYLGIALSRQAGAEVASGNVTDAEPNFQQLISLARTQKKNGTLDSEEILWMIDLADAYLSHQNPTTRESCIKNACSLKEVTYGREHIEYSKSMLMLAKFYLERDQPAKALKILNDLQELQTWISGKPADPSLLGNFLYQTALDCTISHNYKASDAIARHLIKMASSQAPLQPGLPAFNSLLGMNALAQGRTSEEQQYFTQAIKECKRISTPGTKQAARIFLETLVGSVKSEMDEKHYSFAGTVLKHFLTVQELLFKDPSSQYGIYNLLSIALDGEQKPKEAEKYLQQAINLAARPHSYNAKDLPELYLRLGIFQRPQSRISDMASDAFAKALKFENDKSGFHSILVLFWWGKHLREERTDIKGAFEKWNSALALARALPSDKRGTLVADTLVIMANSLRRSGNEKKAQQLEEEAHSEIQNQHNLGSKLGPDHFQMLHSYDAVHR